MGFFKRMSDIISANINDLLDRMEHPEKMMKQLIREMEEAVEEAKGQLVKGIADQRRIEKEIAVHKVNAEQWQGRAVEAVTQDRDDLARKALELKRESLDILAALEPHWKTAQETCAAMKTQFRALQAKLQEAKRKQANLGARHMAAGLQKKRATAGRPSSKQAAFAEFERVEEKVVRSEAEAQAALEVSAMEKSAEQEFLEWRGANEIDAELAALRKKVKQRK